MNRNFLPLLLIFGLLITSCNKDTTPTKISNNEISFGDDNNGSLMINQINPALEISSWSNGGEVSDSLDLDNDNQYDIIFKSFGSHWADTRNCEIRSINNSVEFLVDVIQDSSYRTLNNQNSSINSSKVVWNSFSDYSSNSNNDSLTLVRSENLIKNFNANETLDLSDPLLNWESKGNLSNYAEGLHQDEEFHYHIRLGYWNELGDQYFCYRKSTASGYEYGWVKARVENNQMIKVSSYSTENN